ncbi:hypothetical protein RHMOL_Rhmol12G0055500 [Rhododendron molle]|uniref:Uncharacterized protein n=2 Tax=Rhododendron molle TaxID=49168 RepID=A0ACC0LF69_RHOML|nr:hypothetical protein RHMOL_Rhmol12G0055500 [Rhododendron molle]KAI8527177.1 hypothetical protein RHMOL_Rhmol12G0055500 [Rhododendron molle]
MAETSRSQFTITLGRSGQVVKRAGAVLDRGFSDSRPAIGGKRSIRDRLGTDVDGFQLNNKRQRGYSNKLNNWNGVEDARLGKDDLRFKLRRKNKLRRELNNVQMNKVDRREAPSRSVRHTTTSLNLQPHMPERRDARDLVPEREGASILSQIPYTRSADALPRMDSLRDSNSPWTLDRVRRRSPDVVFRTSRNLSPQRNDVDITRRPLMRAYDDDRTRSYMSSDILERGRSLGTSSYMTKPPTASAPLKSFVPPLALPSRLSGIVNRSSYMGNEHLTVDGLLYSLGLESYSISFKAEEVDMTALRQMGDNDLKQLGIPMGPRKKILLALLPRSQRLL